MLANAQVSNNKERVTAISKTIGVYLITLLLLIFIFRNNRNSVSAGDEIVKTSEQRKIENDALKLMLGNIDTIAVLTGKLMELDEQERKDPGSKQGEMDRVDAQISQFYQEIRGLEQSEATRSQIAHIDNVYDVLQRLNKQIIVLRAAQQEQAEDFDEEKESKALEDQTKELEAAAAKAEQGDTQAEKIEELKDKLKKCEDDLKEADKKSKEQQKAYDKAKEKIVKVQSYLNKELDKDKLIKNWKPIVETSAKMVDSAVEGM